MSSSGSVGETISRSGDDAGEIGNCIGTGLKAVAEVLAALEQRRSKAGAYSGISFVQDDFGAKISRKSSVASS